MINSKTVYAHNHHRYRS